MEPSTASVWRVSQVELRLDEPDALLAARAARSLGLDPTQVRGARIARKALDARRRGGERRLRFVCNVDLWVDADRCGAQLARAERAGRVTRAPLTGTLRVQTPDASWGDGDEVAVIGCGPAGLFAALVLATNGVRARIVERGPALSERGRAVVRFHRTRTVDRERNLLFGEGGAGTYSDGKIYTRVDDPLEVPLLEVLVEAGAPPEIVYDSLAHIGTDRLHRVLPRLRQRLIDLGVAFSFDTRVDGLRSIDVPGGRRAVALRSSAGEIPCSAVVCGIGHSARDSWEALARDGVAFEAKPFQLGLRIEHPQALIDEGRYGGPVRELGPASYNLVARADGARPGAHSFCMCPGGRIVAAVNEPGLLCTNGMSNSKHSSAWASSALVTTFGPSEFGSRPFAGVDFQRELERRFFAAGGGDFTAPAQTARAFLERCASSELRHTTYTFGTRPARLDELLPPAARDALSVALVAFDRQIRGFSSEAGTFVGLESRSSGPVRMPRDARTRRALGWDNLYPVGEGAGYAGGIMSAALDGANAALALVQVGPRAGAHVERNP